MWAGIRLCDCSFHTQVISQTYMWPADGCVIILAYWLFKVELSDMLS